MDRYWDDYNPDLLPLIPPDAKVILEVGCGAGRLCEAYRRINPKVEWSGIEINDEAAKLAMSFGRCDQVDNDDIEDCPPSFLDDVDCLILGDILEHLRDPWKLLKHMASSIKPNGQVLASIPNVQHYSVILGLLRGHWPYSSEGLLDWTHLRFFTLETIKEMFGAAGLDVFEIRGRRIDCEADFKDWEQILARLNMPSLVKPSMVYQYLVRSVRPALKATHGEIVSMERVPIPRISIHAIGDGTICERPRLAEPLAMLSTIPGVRCSTNPVQDPGADIVIIQRARGANLDYHRAVVDRGSLLIAEIDDDPEWLVGLPECNFMPLRAVHAIQTTTEVMAETCRQFNPHVAVFPNQIASLTPPRKYHVGGPVIFFGALNRENDWAPIMPALNRVLATHSDIIVHVVHDRAFFNALETSCKTFHPFCQWEEYRKILHVCDIALLPLEDNRVNRHKSDIKFIECAAEGVACIMSETAWDAVVSKSHGIMAYTYNDEKSFAGKLEWLIDHDKARLDVAANAYAYVRDHRLLSQHYWHRYNVYTHWLSQRSELTRDLLERVPMLRPAMDPVELRPGPVMSPA